MSGDLALEILGYVASALIAISLMMRSIIRLRWINLVGSVCFTIYGVLIDAYPVAAVNLVIVMINVYFLVKMRRSNEAFAVIEMGPESAYLREFLSFHAADIESFQPGFAFAERPGRRIFVVLRDLVPAGVVVTEPGAEPGRAWVSLDYVTPAYRDFKIGDYLFNRRRDLFRGAGFDRLETAAGTTAHARYLQRVGFDRRGETFLLDLVPD